MGIDEVSNLLGGSGRARMVWNAFAAGVNPWSEEGKTHYLTAKTSRSLETISEGLPWEVGARPSIFGTSISLSRIATKGELGAGCSRPKISLRHLYCSEQHQSMLTSYKRRYVEDAAILSCREGVVGGIVSSAQLSTVDSR